MRLQRLAWLVTAGACMITAGLLLTSGYRGYGGVFIAVGVAAAINLL